MSKRRQAAIDRFGDTSRQTRLGRNYWSNQHNPPEPLISQKELRSLLQELESGMKSAELVLPDGKAYYATASAVIADCRPVGRVCVLRDVTHLKELDALKSDFVFSVSHDLRSPLTLMRGCAIMLDTVGELNDQQKMYVSRILAGVDGMTRLANNLLDLSRIEAGVGLQVKQVAVMEVVDGVVDTL